ncbi:hypothetical protein ABK040_013542 [Willaertia magna]
MNENVISINNENVENFKPSLQTAFTSSSLVVPPFKNTSHWIKENNDTISTTTSTDEHLYFIDRIKRLVRQLFSINLCLSMLILSLILISTVAIFAVTFVTQQRSIEEYSSMIGNQLRFRTSEYITQFMKSPFQILEAWAIKSKRQSFGRTESTENILNMMYAFFAVNDVTFISYTRSDDYNIGMFYDNDIGSIAVEVYRDGVWTNSSIPIISDDGVVALPDPKDDPGDTYPNHMNDMAWWTNSRDIFSQLNQTQVGAWSTIYADYNGQFWISAYRPLFNYTFNNETGETEKVMDILYSIDLEMTIVSNYLRDNLGLSKNSFVYIVQSKDTIMVASSKIDNDELFVFDLTQERYIIPKRLNESKIDVVSGVGNKLLGDYGFDISNITIPSFKYNGYQIEISSVTDKYGLSWSIIAFVAIDDFSGQVIEFRNIVIIVDSIVITFSLIMAIIISRLITSPLSRLGKKMEEIRKINISSDFLKPNGDDDSEDLEQIPSFNENNNTNTHVPSMSNTVYPEPPKQILSHKHHDNPTQRFKFLQNSLFYEVSVLQKHFTKMSHAVQGFMKYVPVEIVSTFLKGDPSSFELGVSEKRIAIFFSDIANFTSICESLEPSDIIEMLGHYFEKLSEIIYQNKGILDKYIGDAVMALFGAPETFEDYAYYCCYAAYEIQIALKKMNSKFSKIGLPTLNTRIGISVGDVLLGNIGSSFRLSYTCLGDSVNLAARLEGLNKMYGTSILISDSCYQLVKERFVCRLIDMVAVKGKSQGEKVYEVVCRMDHSTESIVEQCLSYENILTECYWKKDFTLAKAEFESFGKKYPKDKASIEMIRRCDDFMHRDAKIFEQWDGVFVATEK